MTENVKRIRRSSRPTYLAHLKSLAVGEEAHFRIVGTAYTNFYNAKWRIEKTTDARYEMRKVDKTTLRVKRIS